jgi:hypothetical protein
MAVLAGIFLVIDAINRLQKSKETCKFMAYMELVIGTTTIYIDGFVFLPSFIG